MSDEQMNEFPALIYPVFHSDSWCPSGTYCRLYIYPVFHSDSWCPSLRDSYNVYPVFHSELCRTSLIDSYYVYPVFPSGSCCPQGYLLYLSIISQWILLFHSDIFLIYPNFLSGSNYTSVIFSYFIQIFTVDPTAHVHNSDIFLIYPNFHSGSYCTTVIFS